MKNIKMVVNSEILSIFKRSNIPAHDGLAYLLLLYYGLEPSYMPPEIERKVLATNIVTKDYIKNEVKWNTPLFEEQVLNYEWISDWMDLFGQTNPERRGVKSLCITRMKKLFMNNPSVTVSMVMEATNNYIKNLSSAKYCMKSHKFIECEENGSTLLSYIEGLSNQRFVDQTIEVI